MTRGGPKPTPRNLRVVRTGKAEGRLTEPPEKPVEEPPVRIPEPPDELAGEQVDVFVSTAQKLARMRIMTEVDVDALVIYARNWIDARQARERVYETGLIVKAPKTGVPMLNPWLPIARKAEDTCIKIMAEFGLTPSSRNRVSR